MTICMLINNVDQRFLDKKKNKCVFVIESLQKQESKLL